MATVRTHRPFSAHADAQALEKAMKGAGTDEAAIIAILTNRTVSQRKEIQAEYKSSYGKDLLKRLKGELSGDFEQAVLWSFYTRAEVNAAALRKAMKGAGTNDSMLIDIICTQSNHELRHTREAYKRMFDRDLEKDIQSDTSGDYERLLVALLQGRRLHTVDPEQARKDCEILMEAGEGRFGTDESTFTRIFCTRSRAHIRLISEYYEKATGHDLLKAVEKETSKNFRKALCRIVFWSISKTTCYAAMLYEAMKGAGTDDDSLIRIMLYYSETDLKDIAQKFALGYEKGLADMIQGDTSGDYKRYILGILN